MFLETLKMPLHSQGVRCKFQPKGSKDYVEDDDDYDDDDTDGDDGSLPHRKCISICTLSNKLDSKGKEGTLKLNEI